MPYYQMSTPSSSASLDLNNVGQHSSQSLTNYNYPLHPTATAPVFGTTIREISNGNNTDNTYCPYPTSNPSSYFLQTDFIRERMQF